MTTNQQMFILAVEEMSFSKAAERAFVTQQCLSNHIQRLEKLYGAKLFERTPRLTLTEAGKTLYQAFTKIRDIEENTRMALSTSSQCIRGVIRIGLHVNRARTFLPAVFEEYHKLYPEVQIKVRFTHTAQVSDLLLNDEIDIALSANAGSPPNIRTELIGDEVLLVIVHPKLLKKVFPNWDLSRTTITVEELSQLPLATSASLSILNQTVEHFARYCGYSLRPIFFVDDYQTQLKLCEQGTLAMYCPENTFLDTQFDSTRPEDDILHFLYLDGFNDRMLLSLMCSAHRQLPIYIQDFCDILKKAYNDKITQLRQYRISEPPDVFPQSEDTWPD